MVERRKKPEIRFAGYETEWIEKKFDDTFDMLSNNTYSRDALNYDEGIAKNIHYGDVLVKFGEYLDVSREKLPYINDDAVLLKFLKSYLKDGDIVFADTAEDESVGKCTEVIGVGDTPVISGLHTMPCRPKEKYAPKYMGYYLNSSAYHDKLLPLMQGVKVTSISRTAIKDTDVMLSDEFSEQAKIGEFLSSLDDMITAELSKYEKLIIVKKSMIEKMYTKDGANAPEIRFDGFTDSWEQWKAKEIFKPVVDKGYPDLPVLSASQEYGMINRAETGINIHHDIRNENGYKRVLPGQFVIHLRSFQGGFAHSVLEGITSPAYTVFDFQEQEKHYDHFWKYIFKSKIFINRLELITYGIRDGRSISFEDFSTLDFYFPSYEEQERIGRYFQELDTLIALHLRRLEKLRNVKSSCMEKMFV